jgi:Integrase core domain
MQFKATYLSLYIDVQLSYNKGYAFLLTVVDHFTNFGWVQPLKTKQARGVLEFLQSLFATFGRPKILHSDNGTEFVAGVCISFV